MIALKVIHTQIKQKLITCR